MTIRIDEVTRLEVIDEQGRAYVGYNKFLTFSFQDDNKTLKVFVSTRNEEEH